MIHNDLWGKVFCSFGGLSHLEFGWSQDMRSFNCQKYMDIGMPVHLLLLVAYTCISKGIDVKLFLVAQYKW